MAFSTAGSIAGTLGTTFFLIPAIGSRGITLVLGAVGLIAGLAMLAVSGRGRATSAMALASLLVLRAPSGHAQGVIDESVRAAMATRADGRIAHLETQYNHVFITKRQNQLVMSFQVKGWDYTESVTNLLDADDLPLRYTQVMTAVPPIRKT